MCIRQKKNNLHNASFRKRLPKSLRPSTVHFYFMPPPLPPHARYSLPPPPILLMRLILSSSPRPSLPKTFMVLWLSGPLCCLWHLVVLGARSPKSSDTRGMTDEAGSNDGLQRNGSWVTVRTTLTSLASTPSASMLLSNQLFGSSLSKAESVRHVQQEISRQKSYSAAMVDHRRLYPKAGCWCFRNFNVL